MTRQVKKRSYNELIPCVRSVPFAMMVRMTVAARVLHDEQRRHRIRHAMWIRVRRLTALDESASALGRVPREPLVAGLPADAIPCAELRQVVQSTLMIHGESKARIHRGNHPPGNSKPRERAQTVGCHASCRNTLLPINRAYTHDGLHAVAADERTERCR